MSSAANSPAAMSPIDTPTRTGSPPSGLVILIRPLIAYTTSNAGAGGSAAHPDQKPLIDAKTRRGFSSAMRAAEKPVAPGRPAQVLDEHVAHPDARREVRRTRLRLKDEHDACACRG